MNAWKAWFGNIVKFRENGGEGLFSLKPISSTLDDDSKFNFDFIIKKNRSQDTLVLNCGVKYSGIFCRSKLMFPQL